MVFLCHCFESAVGLLWYFPFLAVGLLCDFCGGVAVILLWNCLGFPWSCCRLAAASLWYRYGVAVESLWTSGIFMWDDNLLWDCLGMAV